MVARFESVPTQATLIKFVTLPKGLREGWKHRSKCTCSSMAVAPLDRSGGRRFDSSHDSVTYNFHTARCRRTCICIRLLVAYREMMTPPQYESILENRSRKVLQLPAKEIVPLCGMRFESAIFRHFVLNASVEKLVDSSHLKCDAVYGIRVRVPSGAPVGQTPYRLQAAAS